MGKILPWLQQRFLLYGVLSESRENPADRLAPVGVSFGDATMGSPLSQKDRFLPPDTCPVAERTCLWAQRRSLLD